MNKSYGRTWQVWSLQQRSEGQILVGRKKYESASKTKIRWISSEKVSSTEKSGDIFTWTLVTKLLQHLPLIKQCIPKFRWCLSWILRKTHFICSPLLFTLNSPSYHTLLNQKCFIYPNPSGLYHISIPDWMEGITPTLPIELCKKCVFVKQKLPFLFNCWNHSVSNF